MLRTYGIAPTGPEGAYRRRDYLRGALGALCVVVVLFIALLLASAGLGTNSRSMPWITFILGIGALVAGAAMLVLLAYATFGLSAPPSFADPTAPVREAEDEDDESEHDAA